MNHLKNNGKTVENQEKVFSRNKSFLEENRKIENIIGYSTLYTYVKEVGD